MLGFWGFVASDNIYYVANDSDAFGLASEGGFEDLVGVARFEAIAEVVALALLFGDRFVAWEGAAFGEFYVGASDLVVVAVREFGVDHLGYGGALEEEAVGAGFDFAAGVVELDA